MPAGERRRRVRKGGASQTANSKQRVQQTEKEAQALALRITGASYAQIAQALSFRSKNTAWKAVESALRKTLQEPADEVRALELQRLDRWLFNIDAQIRSGSLEALDRGLKIMTRRATLLGLDAPTKLAPTTPDGTTPYAPVAAAPDHTFFAELATLFQQLGPMHSNGHSPLPTDAPA